MPGTDLQDEVVTPTQPSGGPTSANEWRSARREGVLVTLPSGNRARILRTFDLLVALEQGRIPNPLAAIVTKAIQHRGGDLAMADLAEEPEALGQMLQHVDSQIVKIFREPRVMLVPDGENHATWEPPEGYISIADLDIQDRMFAYFFAQGGAGDLESFREASAKAMAAARDGGEVRDDASGTPESGGSVGGVLPERGDVPVVDARGESTDPGDEGITERGAGEDGSEGSPEPADAAVPEGVGPDGDSTGADDSGGSDGTEAADTEVGSVPGSGEPVQSEG